MRLGKQTLVHFGSQVLISVAGFAATFAIARVGGAGALGQYRVAVALGFFWLAIPATAIGNATAKRMSEGKAPAEALGAGLAVNAVLASVLFGLVLGLGTALEFVTGLDSQFVVVLRSYTLEVALLVVGAAAFKTSLSGLLGRKRVGTSGLLKAAERVIRSSIQVGVVAVGMGVAALAGAHVVALLVAAVGGLVIVDVWPSRPTWKRIKSLFEYARYGWLSTLQTRVYGWLDTLVLSVFLSGAGLIGVYEVAWGLASLLGAVSISIRQTLFPEISDISADELDERVAHYLDEGLVFAGVFVIPGLVGAAVVGDRVLRIYGPEFVAGQDVLLVLILAYLADVYGAQFMNVLNAIDRPDKAFRVNLVFILVSIASTVGLTWQFGWFGAAVATAGSTAFRAILGYVVLSRSIPAPSVPVGEFLRQGLAAVAMGLAVVGLEPLVPPSQGWTILLVGAGASVYGLVLVSLSGRIRSKVHSFV